MAFDWLISMAASAAGIPQETLDKIEKAMPATKELLDLINRNQALIVTAQALAKQIEPLIPPALELWKKVDPLIPQIQAEMVDITPALSAVLDVLHQHQSDGKSMAMAADEVGRRLQPYTHGGHG
jgi:hypothetical protein